jgi:hypothetical protein
MNEKRVFFEYEETQTTKKKGYITLDMDYTQVYHNIMNCVIKLDDKWSLRYLFWIMPQANENNIIPHSKAIIQKFISWVKLKRPDDTTPSVKTIQDAISRLVVSDIIIKYGYNYYMLNPKVLWGDDVKTRVEYLIMEAKEKPSSMVEDTEITYNKRII